MELRTIKVIPMLLLKSFKIAFKVNDGHLSKCSLRTSMKVALKSVGSNKREHCSQKSKKQYLKM